MLQVTVTVTSALLTLTSIGIICQPWPTKTPIIYGAPMLNYAPGYCDFDLWSTDPKINMAIHDKKKG